MGKCPGCGQWNTLVAEEVIFRAERVMLERSPPPCPITEVASCAGERYQTGIGEFDRVLGGGIVPGSLTLIGGSPGIGKSTLLLQVAAALGPRYGRILYVSGEESSAQTKLRAERLQTLDANLYVVGETNLELIFEYVSRFLPVLLVVDSIQTVYFPGFPGTPGSIGQVRACAGQLLELAKQRKIPVLLVGHVTKAGYLAGPRVLEHLVDTVLYFEGEKYQNLRLLRAVKNRFGPTDELGVFTMEEKGLKEVGSLSEVFLSSFSLEATGSAVATSLEGTRPLLLEVQALVTRSSFPNPRRLSTGLELNRLFFLLAVLEKKVGLNLGTQDVYFNVAGGLYLREPAVDLGTCLAIASSCQNLPIKKGVVWAGEVGLTGEIRPVTAALARVREAEKLGFSCFVLPQRNLSDLKNLGKMEVKGVASLGEALEIAFGKELRRSL